MTTPTNADIPSNSIQDRLFNAEKLDEIINSDEFSYLDRKGVKRYTVNGLRQLILNWMATFSSPADIAYGSSTLKEELIQHGVTTSSYGVGVKKSDDLTSDHTTAFTDMLKKEKFIIVDTVVNLSSTVTTAIDGQVISGTRDGVVRPIASGMSVLPMISVVNANVVVSKVIFDNPMLLKSQTGGRQGAVIVKADGVTVADCIFKNQLNAIVGDSRSSPNGGKIINNWFFDCLGGGDGPTDTTSTKGEDRGDAVAWWGSSVIMTGNHAYCKVGEDARTAFFAEWPVTTPTNPREEYDRIGVIIANNSAYGSFRRHFALEGITNGVSSGNVSNGGSTWWCEYYVNCNNTYVNNQLRYTRKSTDLTGDKWAPKRGAIMVGNYGSNIKIESQVYMAAGSSGFGFVTNTTTGIHDFVYSGTMKNDGDADNIAFNLIRTTSARLDNPVVRGFAKFITFTAGQETTSLKYTHIDVINASYEGTGVGPAIYSSYGTGGTLNIEGGVFKNVGTSVVQAANLHNVLMRGVKAEVVTYFIDISGTSRSIYLDGLVNLSDTVVSIRLNASLAANIGDIEYHSSNHIGVSCNHRYLLTTINALSSRINQYGKYKGRIVPVGSGGTFYIASGSAPADPWYPLTIGTGVVPA